MRVRRTEGYELPGLSDTKARLERSRLKLSSIPIDEWKRHTAKTDALRKVLAAVKQEVGEARPEALG